MNLRMPVPRRAWTAALLSAVVIAALTTGPADAVTPAPGGALLTVGGTATTNAPGSPCSYTVGTTATGQYTISSADANRCLENNGALTVVNNSGDISLDGSSAPISGKSGTLSLTAESDVTAVPTSSIAVGTLTGSAANISLGTFPLSVGTVSDLSATGSIDIGDTSALTIAGPVAAGQGGYVRLVSGGALTLSDDVTCGGEATLTASTINQTSGSISAEAVDAQATAQPAVQPDATDISLTSPSNAFPYAEITTANHKDFAALYDSQALDLVSSYTGQLSVSDPYAVSGNSVDAAALDLSASSATFTGLTTQSVTGSVSGAVSLSGAIGGLGSATEGLTAGSLTVDTTAPVTIAGTVSAPNGDASLDAGTTSVAFAANSDFAGQAGVSSPVYSSSRDADTFGSGAEIDGQAISSLTGTKFANSSTEQWNASETDFEAAVGQADAPVLLYADEGAATVSVQPSPATSTTYGNAVTVTAVVAPSGETGTVANPTGTVKFSLGSQSASCTNVSPASSVVTLSPASSGSSSVATCTLDNLPASSSYQLSATYADDGSTAYANEASGPAPYTVDQAGQTITFASAPQSAAVGGSYQPSASGGASGNAVQFSTDSSSNGSCTYDSSSNTVSFVHVGTCEVDANQDGNSNYSAAAQTHQSFSIGQAGQTITFGAGPSSPTVGGSYSPSASGGSSGEPVTFSIDASSNGNCGYDETTYSVTLVHAGTCVVDANQAGNSDYSAARQVQQSFTVGQASQAITFASGPQSAAVGGSYQPSASGGASGNAVQFSVGSSSDGSCSYDSSSNTVSFVHAGTCVVDANQSGNSDYSAAQQVQQSTAIGMAAQAINFGAAPTSPTVGGSYSPSASGGASGNPVTFSIDPSANGACGFDETTHSVTFVHAGTCAVDANQAGNADYSAAPQVRQSFMVGQASQSITFGAAPSSPTVGGSYSPSASGGSSGEPVTFSIDPSSSGACAYAPSSNTVTFVHAGTCVVDANQAGDADYSAAPQVRQSTAIAEAAQSITFDPASAGTVGGSYEPAASGGASGQPVTFSIDASSDGACSYDQESGVVSFAHAGTCVVDADQAGNADYDAAPQQQQSISIGRASQSILFASGPDSGTVGGAYQPSAQGGASGQAVTFSIDPSSSDVCTYSSSTNTVSFAHAGSCVVDANQAGDGDYSPALQVQQSVPVAAAATHTHLVVRPHGITATVTSPGGTPSGSVSFVVGGSTVGRASLHNGVATLVYPVPSRRTETVAANYSGSADYLASSASTARSNPAITAHVSSARPKSRYGWFRTPVTVSFTCRTNGSPLTGKCPAPVKLTHSAAGQSVTRIVHARNGGVATATVSPIDIDRIAPRVHVAGVVRGAAYDGSVPVARCAATDGLSGVATCRVTSTRTPVPNGYRITYRAVASDRAGNTASRTATITQHTYYVAGASLRAGAYTVRRGHTYTLVALGTSARPVYYDATVYPRTPTGRDNKFRRVGHHEWALGVTVTHNLRSHRFWNIGIEVAGVMHVLKIRVV